MLSKTLNRKYGHAVFLFYERVITEKRNVTRHHIGQYAKIYLGFLQVLGIDIESHVHNTRCRTSIRKRENLIVSDSQRNCVRVNRVTDRPEESFGAVVVVPFFDQLSVRGDA